MKNISKQQATSSHKTTNNAAAILGYSGIYKTAQSDLKKFYLPPVGTQAQSFVGPRDPWWFRTLWREWGEKGQSQSLFNHFGAIIWHQIQWGWAIFLLELWARNDMKISMTKLSNSFAEVWSAIINFEKLRRGCYNPNYVTTPVSGHWLDSSQFTPRSIKPLPQNDSGRIDLREKTSILGCITLYLNKRETVSKFLCFHILKYFKYFLIDFIILSYSQVFDRNEWKRESVLPL